ncbi:hypothetical protein FE257_006653 [Aspergillus nanangensis]|uniref:Uncharacterized protein n=1 Tax=Aspergillus nanangensis TaxID=2582783 RepID=A0AAD4H0J1_ASPNN|nr:hypothetical protein FE257_006653 [Aspergillus nanangensis]
MRFTSASVFIVLATFGAAILVAPTEAGRDSNDANDNTLTKRNIWPFLYHGPPNEVEGNALDTDSNDAKDNTLTKRIMGPMYPYIGPPNEAKDNALDAGGSDVNGNTEKAERATSLTRRNNPVVGHQADQNEGK